MEGRVSVGEPEVAFFATPLRCALILADSLKLPATQSNLHRPSTISSHQPLQILRRSRIAWAFLDTSWSILLQPD